MVKGNVIHKEMLFEDFPEFKVTDEVKKNVRNLHLYSPCRGNVHINYGMFRTDLEKENIDDSLKRKLPNNNVKIKRY